MPEPVVEPDGGKKAPDEPKGPPGDLSWYASPQVLASVAAIGGGIVGFCSAFHIVIPYNAAEITAGLGAAFAVVGGGYALYRRIRAGLDTTNSAPKIKLF